MSTYYRDYVWVQGLPMGLQPIDPLSKTNSYKIISDPYRKRISIEFYTKGIFERLIYDSALLNYRHIKKPEQAAWQKSKEIDKTYIRNEDDRLMFIETYCFKNGLCTECCISSPHGIILSIQRMRYNILQDPFNGVILYDINEHPVMFKLYDFDDKNLQFTSLLKEEWDMEKHPPHG